jgi:hypothetical protein
MLNPMTGRLEFCWCLDGDGGASYMMGELFSTRWEKCV